MDKERNQQSQGQAPLCKTVIVQNGLAHYRYPIYGLLSRQRESVEYSFCSGRKLRQGIKTIDPSLADKDPQEGGLRWCFVRNFNIRHPFVWQTGQIRLALSRKIDTIIYQGEMYILSNWVGAVLARLSGKRVLMWSHGVYEKERGLKGWIRRRFYKLAHGLLLYGNYARNILIGHGFNPDNLYVVFNSLDHDAQVDLRQQITAEKMSAVRAELFTQPELPMLVFVGRLTPQKKLDMLLQATAKLSERGIDANVLIIGDGPDRSGIEALTYDLAITNQTVFYGPCYDEARLATLIAAADVCVSPGNVGLTAMHAMVYGTPVITHNNPVKQGPEFETVIEGKSGMLFEEDNADDLTKKLEHWLSSQRSRDEVRRDCYVVIDKHYNPHVQVNILNAAVTGKPASESLLGGKFL